MRFWGLIEAARPSLNLEDLGDGDSARAFEHVLLHPVEQLGIGIEQPYRPLRRTARIRGRPPFDRMSADIRSVRGSALEARR